MTTEYLDNLKSLFSGVKREIVSPFEKGEGGLYKAIASAPENALLFFDVPRDDYPLGELKAASLASGHPFVVGNSDTPENRKIMKSLGFNLFKVKGGDTVFGTLAQVKANSKLEFIEPAIRNVSIRKATLRGGAAESEVVEKRLVTGVVMEPDSVDMDGEFYSADEVEQAMIRFMCCYRNIGMEHAIDISDETSIVETWLVRDDGYLHAGEVVKKGTWMMTLKIWSSKMWESFKSGQLNGFSIGGYVDEKSKELEEVPTT